MTAWTDSMDIEVAVVGAGRWGRLHAEKWATIPGVRLAAIVDAELERAVRASRRHQGVAAYSTVDALPETIRASSVAVDIDSLGEVTRDLLRRGVHVLTEKPLAASRLEAEALHTQAQRAGLHLAVGFLERFNGSVSSIIERPWRLISHRVGPQSSEGTDWLLDWLVHDIDLTHYLFAEPVFLTGIRARPCGLSLSLVSRTGRVARLYAGAAQRRRRRLWVDGRSHDLLSKGGDPLGEQLAKFAALVRGGPPGALALADAGIDVLAVVDAARRVAQAA